MTAGYEEILYTVDGPVAGKTVVFAFTIAGAVVVETLLLKNAAHGVLVELVS